MKNSIEVFDWNKIWKNYYSDWNITKKYINQQEVDFVQKNIYWKSRILEYWVWTWRLLSKTVLNSSNSIVIWVDISNVMINICKEKFFNYDNIDYLLYDWLDSLKKLDNNFDYIYAIRSIKYDPKWKEIINILCSKLKKWWLFTISMPNKFSLNFFYKTNLYYKKTSFKEIIEIFNWNWFDLVESNSFSKLPNFFYKHESHYLWSFLNILEKILSKILWWNTFWREIFFTFEKKQ